MTEFFSSPNAYLEKRAITANMTGEELEAAINAVKGSGKGGMDYILGAPGKLLSWTMKKPQYAIPAALGIGGLGALGLFKAFSGDQPGETYSYRINRALNSLTDRIKYDEAFASRFAEGLGGQTAEAVTELAKDVMGKSVDVIKDKLMLSPARSAIFQALKKEDPILADADNKTLLEAFHTMSKVAPTLSADKNAVKSVLRMAATSGGGLDYNTIKGLADAETSVNKARGEMR